MSVLTVSSAHSFCALPPPPASVFACVPVVRVNPGWPSTEIAEDAWIVEPPRREEVFTEEPDDLWAAVLRRKGRRYALLSTMPPDPSLN